MKKALNESCQPTRERKSNLLAPAVLNFIRYEIGLSNIVSLFIRMSGTAACHPCQHSVLHHALHEDLLYLEPQPPTFITINHEERNLPSAVQQEIFVIVNFQWKCQQMLQKKFWWCLFQWYAVTECKLCTSSPLILAVNEPSAKTAKICTILKFPSILYQKVRQYFLCRDWSG